MLQTHFNSISKLRDRLKGLELLWDVKEPNIYLHDLEGGHTDSKGEAIFFSGGLRRVVAIGYYYLTIRDQEGGLVKIAIDGTQQTWYTASLDY